MCKSIKSCNLRLFFALADYLSWQLPLTLWMRSPSNLQKGKMTLWQKSVILLMSWRRPYTNARLLSLLRWKTSAAPSRRSAILFILNLMHLKKKKNHDSSADFLHLLRCFKLSLPLCFRAERTFRVAVTSQSMHWAMGAPLKSFWSKNKWVRGWVLWQDTAFPSILMKTDIWNARWRRMDWGAPFRI